MSAAAALAVVAGSSHVALADELQALATRLRAVTVRIHTRGDRFDGVGAGVLWSSSQGTVVVTNAHVVPTSRGDEPFVEDAEGRVASARVVARDRDHDLALLRLSDVDGSWLGAPAVTGDARALRTGELVVALGHPFGVEGALSIGIVHAAPTGQSAWVRADVRLAPGNSGGPLATLDGSVVGINAMIVRGLGIAVPADVVDAFVRGTAPNGSGAS